MTPIPKFETIKIIPTANYIPHTEVNFNLIKDKKIIKFLSKLKNKDHKIRNEDPLYLYDLCKIFDCKLVLKKNWEDTGCSGICEANKRRITLTLSKRKRINKRTITHELAHIILSDLNIGLNEKKQYYLTEIVKEEQQTEALSYYISTIFFKDERVNKKDFKTYFCEKDILWLEKDAIEQGYRIINDLYIFQG